MSFRGEAAMTYLIPEVDLPQGFRYPADFIDFLRRPPPDLKPWFLLEGAMLRDRYTGLQKRYPQGVLVPFARRQDNDDVAAWDGEQGWRVVIVHDFASPGWEKRVSLATFSKWLELAANDHDDFVE
jgi:hypothetical protein